MDRIQRLAEYVDGVIAHDADAAEQHVSRVHLYGVSTACALIAAKRGADVEMATLSGMLHDLHSYKARDAANHAQHGSLLAKEVLGQLGLANEAERTLICSAIRNHSDKAVAHSDFDEILKDADVLHHCLFSPTRTVMDHERARWESLKTELGLSVDF